ncbi:MAG: hypothetical protein EHM65_01245 [Acidobacteriales bacterium]|nr:MAG: hypothetical protein EHM65_01245 [Terriglobales bacterium]
MTSTQPIIDSPPASAAAPGAAAGQKVLPCPPEARQSAKVAHTTVLVREVNVTFRISLGGIPTA